MGCRGCVIRTHAGAIRQGESVESLGSRDSEFPRSEQSCFRPLCFRLHSPKPAPPWVPWALESDLAVGLLRPRLSQYSRSDGDVVN